MTAALIVPHGTGVAHRVNPVAKLIAAFVIAGALVPSIDWVSAAVALVAELLLLPWAGLPPKRLLLRISPVLVAAPIGALSILLYGEASGRVWFHWFAVVITDGSVTLAIATLIRILAIGVPAIVLFATVDPTEFADSLAQVLRLPSRFVLGALAALRLVGLFFDDWRSLGQARRARGIADRGRLRRFPGQAFALLVLAIRRAGKLATAMEARAFGSSIRRTWARPSRLHGVDVAFIAVFVAIGTLAILASILSGHWNPILGPS